MRIPRWLALLLALAFAFLPNTAFAQTKEITHAEFWSAVTLAFATTRNVFPRREIETYEGFRGGRSFRRTKTTEYVASDTFRRVTETREGDVVSVAEMITIGKERYCRENSSEWRTSKCYENPPAALEDAIESSFRVEKKDKRVIYTRKSMFLQSEAGKAERTKFMSEDILVLNSDLTVRERTITKSALDTGTILSREILTREYGLKLNPIDAPIK
jgi:hypothetical protein